VADDHPSQRSFPISVLILSGCLIVATCLGLRRTGGEQSSPEDVVQVVRSGSSGTSAIPAPPAMIGSSQSQAPTLDWLVGTWSRRDNKDALRTRCDLASVITYLTSGYYVSPVGSGRYALNGATLTTWGKVVFDNEAGADRSHVNERSSTSVTRLGENAMQSQGVPLYRCDKVANDSTGLAT
jgi:hypothetical protein